MKYPYSLVVCLFLLCTGFVRAEEVVHVIQKGETIYSIAQSYGVSPEEVLTLNKINNARAVQVGQKIRIPGLGGEDAPSAYDEYQVERNDTFYSIARRYTISLTELLDMNGFAPGYMLKAGEKIRVPAARGTPTGQWNTPTGQGNTSGEQEKPTVPPVSVPEKPDPTVQWPVKPKAVAYLTGGLYGVQVTGEQREPVKSLTKGTVVSTGPFRGFGNVAIVQKPDGYLYVYGGCETLSVKEGDKVIPGTELGKLGIDAKTSKPQLFFLVYRGNTPVDPAKAPRT